MVWIETAYGPPVHSQQTLTADIKTQGDRPRPICRHRGLKAQGDRESAAGPALIQRNGRGPIRAMSEELTARQRLPPGVAPGPQLVEAIVQANEDLGRRQGVRHGKTSPRCSTEI
ncbi:hypothetical protein BOO71_0014521 [Deinococcus marmoris]|uniref:Uncharacterized protein n=1 Tax=Deinococcus marmoris TaxID=249408 RepID=A0A1U7NRL6_9DEIO|nr:hypothetical protein BOO71_0014521 [Deinococcus marmoris]